MSALETIGLSAEDVVRMTGSNRVENSTEKAIKQKARDCGNRSMRIKRMLMKWTAGGTIIIGGITQTAASMFQHEIVAAVIVAEAGGEGYVGMEAVREVIANRARERKLTESHVVLEPLQFSCLNGVSANDLIEKARKHKRWNMAFGMAIEPPKTRHTAGANHYLNPKTVKRLPKWASDKKWTVTIGNHKFYKL